MGADRELAVDLQVIAATHRNLEESVAQGTLRGDLYARLSQSVVCLPPLRERKGELLSMARKFAEEQGVEALSWTVDAAEALLSWHWPFNIRELQSLVRAATLAQGPRVTLDLDYLHASHPKIARAYTQRKAEGQDDRHSSVHGVRARVSHDRDQLRTLLDVHAGNISDVAKAVGKPRAQVYRWMRALGVSSPP